MLVCFPLDSNIGGEKKTLIFVLAENDDPATTSAIFDLLFFSLNRADRCLPLIDEDLFSYKV